MARTAEFPSGKKAVEEKVPLRSGKRGKPTIGEKNQVIPNSPAKGVIGYLFAPRQQQEEGVTPAREGY